MRLIDVDELKQYIGDCKCCEKCPNKGRKQYECYYDCKFPDYLTEEWERVLDEQPTVETIPIEWINHYMDTNLTKVSLFYSCMSEFVRDWQKEQEDNNGN